MVNRILLVVAAGCVPDPPRPDLGATSGPTSQSTIFEPQDTGGAFGPGEPSESEACPEGIYRVLEPQAPRDSAGIVTYGGECVVILAESGCPDDGEIQELEPKPEGGWKGRSGGFNYCNGNIGMPPHELLDVAFTWGADDTLFVVYDRGQILGGSRETVMLSRIGGL